MNYLLILPLLALTVSCGKITKPLKDMDEMKKTTNEMKDITGKMAETTAHMKSITCNTYLDLKKGNSTHTRTEAIDKLEHAQTMEMKLREAVIYMKSFEFQLQKNTDQTCIEYNFETQSEDVLVEAIDEIFKVYGNYMTLKKVSIVGNVVEDKSILDPSNAKGNAANMFALAAASHKLNTNQKLDVKRPSGLTSLYDLLIDALKHNKAVEDQKINIDDLPVWKQKVLKNKEIAIFLLQMRYNLIVGLAAKYTGASEKIEFWSKVKFKSGIGNPNTWDPMLDKMDISHISKIIDYLNEAVKTKIAIETQVGVKTLLHESLRFAFGTMGETLDKSKTFKNNKVQFLEQRVSDIVGHPLDKLKRSLKAESENIRKVKKPKSKKPKSGPQGKKVTKV